MRADYLDSIQQERRAALHELVPLAAPRSAEVGDRFAGVDAGAERGAARQQIDRGDVLDELVFLGPPAEARRVLRPGVHDAGDAQPDRLEGARIGEVDLHAVATR